jgi:starch phosphorylase
VIDRKEMHCELGVECVVVDHDTVDQMPVFVESYEFNLVKVEGSLLYYETRKTLNDPGNHQYGLRVYPRNHDLPHRMDFAYMRWI